MNTEIVRHVLEIVSANRGVEGPSKDMIDFITKVSQPCRFERLGDNDVILDVCHNLQGIEAVLDRISVEYPDVDNISIVFTISKKKKIDEVLDLFEADQRISDVHVVGRPHFKLMPVVDAHKIIS